MVRKSTWVLLVVLLGLVGLSLYLQTKKDGQLVAPTATSSMIPLFQGQSSDASSVRIENAAGDAVEISRSADGKWIVNAPSRADADQAAAEAAATQAAALRSLSTVRLAPAVVGLDNPAYTLSIGFAGGAPSHRLLVGFMTPIQDGYYAQLDNGAFQVVDKTGLDVLIGLLRAPPYPATPTPVTSGPPMSSPTELTESPPAAPIPATATASP